MKPILHAALSILCCLLFVPTSPLFAADTYHSGFLPDYNKLQPDPTDAGTLRFAPDEKALGKYDKFLLTPIEIWYSPDTKYRGVSPDEMKAISDSVHAAIVDALEPDYAVVTKPGPGVAIIDVAITNVDLQKKKRGLLGYTPVGLVVTSAMRAAGMNTSLTDARLEFHAADSESGELIGMMVSRYPGEKKDKLEWEQIGKLADWYAKRFRARLDAAHGD